MTTPDERTRAVLDTRGLLETLVGGQISMIDLVRSVAVGLLRDYPQPADLASSAKMLPEIWATPSDSKRAPGSRFKDGHLSTTNRSKVASTTRVRSANRNEPEPKILLDRWFVFQIVQAHGQRHVLGMDADIGV